MGFAAGFAAGYKTVSDIRERKEKREQEAKELAMKKAKAIKEQNNKIESETNDLLLESQKSLESYNEEKNKIMTSDKYDEKSRMNAVNNLNRTFQKGMSIYDSMIKSKTSSMTDIEKVKRYSSIAQNINEGLDFSTYGTVEIDGKKVNLPSTAIEQISSNPNQFGVGKDNNVYFKNKDGEITDELFYKHTSFKGLATEETDPKKMWISEQLDKYPDADISELNAEWSARQEAALQGVKYEAFEKKERYKKANTEASIVDSQYRAAVNQGYTGSKETWKAEQKAIGEEQGKRIATLESLNVQKNMLSYVIKKKIDKPSDLSTLSKDEKRKSSEVLEQYARKNKQPLYTKDDEEMLSKYSAGFNNISYMDKNAEDFTGLIDSVASSISEVTGIGDAEGVGMFKSTLKTLTAQKARAMQGGGTLSNQDIQAAGQAIGQSYLSDKSISGKIRKHAEDVVANMEAIKNKSTTNKYAFELQYEPVIKMYKAIAESSNQDELEIVKKDDLDAKGASIDKNGNISFNIDSLRKKLKDKKDKRNK